MPRTSDRAQWRAVTPLSPEKRTGARCAIFKFNVIAENLDFPWSIAFLPDGDLLVTELGGNLRRVSLDGEVGDPIAGVPKVYRLSQGGLFDVLLHLVLHRDRVVTKPARPTARRAG